MILNLNRLIFWHNISFFFKLKFHSQSTEHFNPIELIFALIILSASFLFNILVCQFGEMVNNQFALFDAKLYRRDWYAFPIEVQQLLLIFMSDTQRPAVYRGYGGIECTRDTFKKVCTAFYWLNRQNNQSFRHRFFCKIEPISYRGNEMSWKYVVNLLQYWRRAEEP